MSLYCCEYDQSHGQTDQRYFIGCRECFINGLLQVPEDFFDRHGYEPGAPTKPGLTYWHYNIASGNINLSGTTVNVYDFNVFLDNVFDFNTGSLYYNNRHDTANWYLPEYTYGIAGSGTLLPNGGLDYPVSGILVADVFGSHINAHAYPVNYGRATIDLVSWPYICQCGALAPQGQKLCLACEQKANGHTCIRCSNI